MVHLCIKRFQQGVAPLTADDISHQLGFPIRLVSLLLFELEKGGILSTVKDNENNEERYQPARDINTLTLSFVIEALENVGTDNIPVDHTDEMHRLAESLKNFQTEVEKSEANLLLKDI
jgi:hypothetical protein